MGKTLLFMFAVSTVFFSSACSAASIEQKTLDIDPENLIALTFDDGPTDQVTLALLGILKTYNAKATFFPMATKMQAEATLMGRMVAEGHSIGNHTMNHQRLTGLSSEEIRAEIESKSALLHDISGQRPDVFRPPYAALNDEVVEVARVNGLAIVLWSIYPETFGWSDAADAISDHVVSAARDGDIVFLHDTSMRTVEATETILRDLSAKGFKFVTVAELIRRRGTLMAGKTYETGRGADEERPH